MNVADIMNRNPARVQMDDTLSTALRIMVEQKTRHVVVMKEPDDVAGIVTDSDLAMYYDPVKMTPERWEQMKVSQLMTARPVSIGSHAPIEAAAKMLLKAGVTALPVIENGDLRGILSERDFVRHFARESEQSG